MKITVHSFGAAKTVTGSCHLLEAEGLKILIDCGMFQGIDEDKNYQPFPFDPKTVDYLIVTHSHIDHIGRIPLLVKEGFRGKIISTKPTYHIARIMLLDAANVIKEEYRVEYKKALRRGKPWEAKPPLYDEDDVYEAIDQFRIFLDYHQEYRLTDKITVTFKDAGHILGSAYVQIKVVSSKSDERIVVFSGDLGMIERLIINPVEFSKDGNYVFVESTYGNRKHKSLEESIQEFKTAILESLKSGGNIVIPTFALERAQEILYILRQMYDEGSLPECKIFLDSPLAIAATKIFLRFPEYFNKETKKLIREGKNPFLFPYVHFSQTPEESKMINNITSGAIILAGSGMCTGGRIKHHLKHNLWREENSVIFVGYQAKGTLGRAIVDGAKSVKIYGEEIAVKARIYTINGFSAHADQPVLTKWITNFENLFNAYIIHGEPEVQEVFKQHLLKQGIKSHIVEFREPIVLV